MIQISKIYRNKNLRLEVKKFSKYYTEWPKLIKLVTFISLGPTPNPKVPWYKHLKSVILGNNFI